MLSSIGYGRRNLCVRGLQWLVLLAAVFLVCGSSPSPIDGDEPISDEEMEACSSLLSEELADPKLDKRWKKISGGPPGMRIMGMMESGTTTCVFQVAGEIRNVSLAAVVATMEGTDLAARRAWDPSTDELRILAKQGHDDIIHWVTDFPWPLSDREYLYRRRVKHNPDGSVSSVQRVVGEAEPMVGPPRAGVVRVEEFAQTSFARARADGSGVELALRYRNNMNGALPPWLVQWFSSIGLPKYLNQIAAQCKLLTETTHPIADAAPAA